MAAIKRNGWLILPLLLLVLLTACGGERAGNLVFCNESDCPVGRVALCCVWLLHTVYFVWGIKTLKEDPEQAQPPAGPSDGQSDEPPGEQSDGSSPP